MNDSINIFWFRRDLRVHDNIGLYHALKAKNVLPVFIFDPNILEQLPKDDARVYFIHQQLEIIHNLLKTKHSGVAIFHDTPKNVFKQLSKTYSINAVYTNHDYEPYAIQRDQNIEGFLNANGISFFSYKDQVIFEKDNIVKTDGTPYKVYTPYSKKWLEQFKLNPIQPLPSESFLDECIAHHFPFLELNTIGFTEPNVKVKDYKVTPHLIKTYEETRNFPALNSTSKLGPHLRFGTISIRKLVAKAATYSNLTFLKELIWREFFMQILWYFPHTVTDSFKPKYDLIKWQNNKEEFQKWCNGNTGYPLVDAGMRELNSTGFMHNRVRMLVGSFLCKHLLIDWRWGEAYFALKLHDYELSSNVGNWQWVAGCGVDAAPYFRVFNPTTQIEKFDKQHEYIKKWVPEYQELDYINSQIVDHKFARERCLKVYKEALS